MPRHTKRNTTAKRGVNPKQLLKTNLRYVLQQSRSSALFNPTRKHLFVIEFERTSEMRNKHMSASAARTSDSVCVLARIRSNVTNETLRMIPRAINALLLSSANAPTDEKMARMFFTALLQRGEVALKEVQPVRESAPPAPPASAPVVSVADVAADKETDEPSLEDKMKALQEEMAADGEWDDEEEDGEEDEVVEEGVVEEGEDDDEWAGVGAGVGAGAAGVDEGGVNSGVDMGFADCGDDDW